MPIFFQNIICTHTRIGVWQIEEPTETLYDSLMLNNAERAYFKTIHIPSRQKEWLSARVMLKNLLQTDEFVELGTQESGKPVFVHHPSHFSLSHTEGYAAAIISDTPTGIDIEHIKPKIERIRTKFLSTRENEFINPKNTIEHLTMAWAAKETLFKWYGLGNVDFKERLILSPFKITDKTITAKVDFPNIQNPITLGVHWLTDTFVMVYFLKITNN